MQKQFKISQIHSPKVVACFDSAKDFGSKHKVGEEAAGAREGGFLMISFVCEVTRSRLRVHFLGFQGFDIVLTFGPDR